MNSIDCLNDHPQQFGYLGFNRKATKWRSVAIIGNCIRLYYDKILRHTHIPLTEDGLQISI